MNEGGSAICVLNKCVSFFQTPLIKLFQVLFVVVSFWVYYGMFIHPEKILNQHRYHQFLHLSLIILGQSCCVRSVTFDIKHATKSQSNTTMNQNPYDWNTCLLVIINNGHEWILCKGYKHTPVIGVSGV